MCVTFKSALKQMDSLSPSVKSCGTSNLKHSPSEHKFCSYVPEKIANLYSGTSIQHSLFLKWHKLPRGNFFQEKKKNKTKKPRRPSPRKMHQSHLSVCLCQATTTYDPFWMKS